MNRILPILILCGFLCSCAMLRAWKSIPPPGGCDQCHTVPISANWQVVYKAPTLNDERDRLSFQTEQYNMPQKGKPASSLELRKEQDELCFDCHKLPDAKHMERKGRYHHQ
jgi:hypothetical protein